MRKVKTIISLVFCFCLSAHFMLDMYAQEKTTLQTPNYKKIEVPYTSDDIFVQIAKLGIDVHCGVDVTGHQSSKKVTLEVSESEYNILKEAGLNPNVVIDDLSNFYAKRNIKDLPVAKKQIEEMKARSRNSFKMAQDMGCVEDSYPVPQNFELGSMGGFTTYQEMLDELDQMRSLYPNLISPRIPASTTETTIEGRTVYYVRLSDNPDVDESEPEVFYNGVHHAREPLSMMNQLYYMWYLLENYNSDPSIKNIVDNVEMYFIPVVNPDGYVYNQTTNPNGGGMWRKNRRNNGNGTIGVDLNRNYSYQWGYDNSGSSGSSSSDTYRGPSPFSEPESRIIRDFTYEREFINVFNNHSYSNLMLHAWGYIPDDCPDEELFDEISEHMCWHNRYNYGNNNKVLYPTNGDANDWHYGEQTTKRKILAWIPEIGSAAEGGFWPSLANIVPQCVKHMHMSLVLAQSAANFGVINDLTPYGIDNQNTSLTFNIEHMSLVPGGFTVSVSSSDPNVASIANPVMSTGVLTDANYETISTGVTLANNIAAGTEISFDIVVNNGAYDIHTTTITKVYQPVEIISDVGANLSNWTSSGGWGTTSSTGYNSASSIADSPSGNMTTTLRTMTLNNPIDLSGSQNPVLEYYTKWDIYRLFDYVQIQASTNGSNWSELCGEYTKQGASPDNVWGGTGTPEQPTGDGLYDGYQKEWVREQIDLSSYAGINTLYLRFISKGDSEVAKRDGIYIDNFTVYREPLGHCENSVQDADETGVDCGGADCVTCPTCFDGVQNGNETGTDCGGNCGVCPVCPTSVSNFPYTEGFESGLGQWSQSGSDDINWTRNSAGTPSADTGPSSASQGSWYMYIEASNPNYPTKTAGLISPCFNLTGMTTASLTFQYHLYGTSADMNLNVQASIDGGNAWSAPIWSQTGNQGNQWNTATIDLNAYANQYVMLRIWGTTGETWQGDISIDDIGFDAAPPACTPGTTCNDNDACTTGDVYDNACNCSGTFADADGDGICDNNDQCPGNNDGLIGTTCNDNDPCTTGDVYDNACNCAGTFADADGDGVCDADDVCANNDDTLDADGDGVPDGCDNCDANSIGTSCSDGDPCTTGETFDSNCNCTGGTFADADGDGVCDTNDQCPGSDDSVIGTTCSDNDPCTTGDVYDSACNCAGTFADADGDGVCDASDVCANGDDTMDADGDGIPDACDNCDANSAGTSCSDGDPCTTGETYDANCNCTGGTFADADGDGVCDSNDQCPGNDDSVIGTACNDNNACTTGDVYDSACNCSGTLVDSDGDGVCDANDICPNGDDNTDNNGNGLPDACEPCPIYDFNTYPVLGYDPGQDFGPWEVRNGGTTLYMTGNAWKAIDIGYNITPQTVITFDFKSTVEGEIHELGFDNDLLLNRDQALVVYGNQGYAGTLNNATYSGSGNWESFTVDIGAQFTGSYQYLVLTADDDANSAGNSFYRNIKIFEDTDGDLACDVLCTPGTACDDGDACTTGETFDNACNCSGGSIQDSDGDGVCDADDVCPGSDDTADADGDGIPDACDSCDSTTAGTPCDDNNDCTVNDVTDANCNCAGTFADADGDGVCDASDICANGDDNLDTDNDGTPDACDNCNNNLTGTSCSTGDPCIIGETYDANCNCTGGTTPDADGDGVCDANDICAAGDDNIDSDNDNTPDACDSCPNDANNSCGLPTYCSASANNANYEHIANVSVGQINNTSGSNGGYGDYSNISGNVTPGSTVAVSLTAGYPGTTYSENWRIWIDFNRDGDFSDAGEQVYAGTGVGTINGSLNIPNNASLGATGMRVAMQWNANPNPCGTFQYGEVEDYTIVITAVSTRISSSVNITIDEESLKNTSLQSFEVYPNPAKDFINIDLMNVIRNIDGEKAVNLRIFSTDGKLVVHKVKASDFTLQMNIQDLPSNQYYLINMDIEGINQLSTKFLKL